MAVWVYQQAVLMSMGTNCAPYCYESQFKAKLIKDHSKSDLIDKFIHTYRYLDDNPDFSKYVTIIYPREFTLNKAHQDKTVVLFWI